MIIHSEWLGIDETHPWDSPSFDSQKRNNEINDQNKLFLFFDQIEGNKDMQSIIIQ